eukprot:GEMP01066040.1.p1 GENE.GEMP01066040.1~~GEMP01066040.1.p1  ORF type:complete len:404 (+),score=71.99 GEMP01066040.1:61-1272(+)
MFVSRSHKIPFAPFVSSVLKVAVANKPLLARTAKWAVRFVPWMRKLHLSDGTNMGGLRRQIPTIARHARKLYITAGVGATTCFTLLVGSSLEYFDPLDGIDGRYRLMIYSPEKERLLGHQASEHFMEKYTGQILADFHPLVHIVNRVVLRLIENLEQLPDPQPTWRIHLINSFEVNAFILPSGDIFIYLGMIEAAQNETCMAFVLGHELSHVVARHTVERLSMSDVTSIPMNYLDMETEADRLGMLLIHRSGYDVHKAADLWKRVAQAQNLQENWQPRAHEDFFSTHPCHRRRIEEQREFAAKLAPIPLSTAPKRTLSMAGIWAPMRATMRRNRYVWTFEEWTSHLTKMRRPHDQRDPDGGSTDVVFHDPPGKKEHRAWRDASMQPNVEKTITHQFQGCQWQS